MPMAPMPMQGLDPATMTMDGGAKVPRPDPHMESDAPRQPFNMTEDGGQPASPEEQEIYDKFVAASMMVLWDRNAAGKYVDALRSSPNAKETAADIAAQVGFRVVKNAAKAGTPLPGHIVLMGGMEIASQVGELAERAGVKMTPQDVEQVYYMALDKGRVMAQKAGLLDQDVVAKDAAALDAMGKDGRLEQVMALIGADHKRSYERQPLEDDPRSSFDEDDAPMPAKGRPQAKIKAMGLDEEDDE